MMQHLERDVIVETQSGILKRIYILTPSYLTLQYPLLSPRGEDEFREGIPLKRSVDCWTMIDRDRVNDKIDGLV